jgi:lipopolysaccharide transport system ATP-binding protein
VRDWPDPARAPGGEVTRLRAVRVVAEDGEPSEVVDIRRPVTLEMEYDVLKAGYILLASYDVFNDEGVHVMCLLDQDAAWRRRPRPVGRYVTRAVIPGNFLSEGTLFVDPCVITMEPPVHQFYEREAVAFQVVDSADGDSARGDWGGKLEGAVRPLLQWETRLAAPAPRDEAAVSTRAS